MNTSFTTIKTASWRKEGKGETGVRPARIATARPRPDHRRQGKGGKRHRHKCVITCGMHSVRVGSSHLRSG
jgi:hypothetical protein